MTRRYAKLCLLLVLVAANAFGQDLPGPRDPNADLEARKRQVLRRFELKQSTVFDGTRLLSEMTGLNIVATDEAGKKSVTLHLDNVRAIAALETMARVARLWFREDTDTGILRVMTAEEYQEDLVVRREDQTRVFTLMHPNAYSVATAIQDLYGQRVRLAINQINDDMLLQTGAIMGSSLSFGGVGGFGGAGSGQGGFGFGNGANRFGPTFGGFSGFGGGGLGGGGFGFGNGGFGRGGFGQGGFNRNGNNQNQGQDRRNEILPDEPLTPGQIAQIEARLRQRGGRDGVNADAIQEVTQREPPIYVTLNRQHNLVIVRTGDGEALKSIEKLVREIDRPTPQVLLEMKILEVQLDDSFRSIFDLQFNNGPSGPAAADQTNANPFLQNAATAARNVAGVGNSPVASGNTLVYQFLNDNVRARLELLETQGRLDTVATPLLLASNNRPARIFVGEERVLTRSVSSNVITPGQGATTTAVTPITELRDIGTNLFLIPKINADRSVTLVINQDNSTVNPDSATIPVAGDNGTITEFPVDTIDTASMSGTIVAKDGFTIAVGGLIRESISRSRQKVPILGDIPLVGRLFRREVDEDTKTELILLITPYVVTTPMEGEVKSRRRIDNLSSHLYLKTPPGPPAYEPGPPFPWAPRRIREGYRRTVGESTGVPAGPPVMQEGPMQRRHAPMR